MDNEKSFEEVVKDLNEITNKIESGEVSLDESLQLYEQAIKLIGICNKQLDKVEQKVKIITGEENGNIIMEDFDGNRRSVQ